MKREILNSIRTEFEALSVNESLARSIVSAFAAQLNPDIDELADLRCAVSEAVTNCVVHAYGGRGGKITLCAKYCSDRSVRIYIKDKGCGIPDVKKAMEPLYTTDTTGERGGMGFAIMENFCDAVKVHSRPGAGTSVILQKNFRPDGSCGSDGNV